MNITFYDILGIDPSLPDRASVAAALWPNNTLSLTPGINVANDSPQIVQLLQQALVFKNVRPGVDPHIPLGTGAPGQLTFAADMHVTSTGLLTSNTFYLRALPDVGIQLLPTDPDPPAQCFFASDGRGYEVLIDRLPVRIFLKRGLASTLATAPEAVGDFQKDKVDGFAYTLQSDAQPSEIDAIVRLHLTPQGDVIFEPSVPISLGPVRFMGLPAKTLYDVQLIPSPNRRDQFEWARNDIGSFASNPIVKGAVGFRSIEMDFSQPPFSDLRARLQNGVIHIENLELVCEDVVVPLEVPVLPIPSHGTFGFRRKITDRTDIANAYDLRAAPVIVPIYGSPPQGGNGGSSLTLSVEKFLFASGNPPTLQLQASLIWHTSGGTTIGATIGVDDDWTLFAGLVLDEHTPVKFTIADVTVEFVGLKFGVSVGRMTRKVSFKDSFELLGDFAIISKPTGGENALFKMRSLTGKELHAVLRDLGYKFGHFSLDGLQMPDGVQLIFANKYRIIIEEMGWVEEPNGTPYFSFSGGVAVGFGGGDAVKPSGDPKDDQGKGVGLRVRRLRFRTIDDDSQPFFKIDGIFLNLHFGTVWIEGFGYISDFEADGWGIKEFGFGVKVQFNAIAMTFSIAAEFIKGSRRELANPSNEFDYFLASLVLGFLPAGPLGLYDIRALVADNMAPNLDSTFPDGEGMALLKWHQEHDGALTMPRSRTLSDWLAERDALSLGVGSGFSLNGCGAAMHLDIFIFFAKSKADTGLLIVGDLFLLKNPKPIGFVAIEYDIDKEKFGVMVGVDLSLADFAGGSVPSWLARIATLTGTLYFGNQPWAFAIGQLADQRSWLSIRVNWDIWITVKFQFGLCIQIVDGGPKAFGIIVTLSAGANWGIGAFILFGSFGFLVGTWKTGSDTSGVEAWIQLGFKINLFWIFSFGADITIKLIYLGKHPWYVTISAEIRIDTPWFLPDVTFHIEKTWREPLPFDTSTITQCLSSASGIGPGRQSDDALLVPPLSDGVGDPKHLYTFNELIAVTGVRIPDTHAMDVPIVSTDATIAINFTQPVSNDSLIATNTYDGTTDTGVQHIQDLQVRYGLQSIAIRRSPRFGPTAGTWSDFVKDSDTQFSLGGTAPETITFAWDVDSRADGKLAPKRLLINSASPYSFAISGPQNDEEAMRNDPDFPCCDEHNLRKLYPKAHLLAFGDLPIGSRTPTGEQFSGNGAWWRWMQRPTPVVAPGDPVYSGSHVARFFPRATTTIGFADCPDPILRAVVTLAWDALPGTLFFEGYAGLQLVAQSAIDLRSAGQGSYTCAVAPTAAGMTRLVLRVEIDPQAEFFAPSVLLEATSLAARSGFSPLNGVAIFEIAYVTLADALAYFGAGQRCKNAGNLGPTGSDASGKLAFLPNHDYEVVVSTKIEVRTKAQGARSFELAEPFYFRTKGLPGLNAAPNVGDDLRPHVESTYPAVRGISLYREEPTVLAFTEGMSSVLPIDRAPAAGDPPEKAQMFPLILNIDRIESLDGLKRLTVPSGDWIAAHRASPYPIFWFLAEPTFAFAKVRRATTLDPLLLRYEAVKAASRPCGPPQLEHASQVLLHEPIDADGNPGAWEPQVGYRATVRQKDGPFTERSHFDEYDLGAFIRQADGLASAAFWSVDGNGNIVAPAPAGGRHYISCGELTWDHLQVHTRLDPRGASAGIAVGVQAGTPVPQAILAMIEADGNGHALVLRKLDGSGEQELGRASVDVTGTLLLNVIAFDDNVRASIGNVVVEGPRGAVREGRVAFVADGPAAFAGIGVDALDIYTFDFKASRYRSFQEHIDSYDGRLGALTVDAFGGTPATIVGVLTAHGSEIAPQMVPSADPQERQKLFATIVGMLGIGLRKNPDALSISRLIDAGGTYGLLVESPEPISLTRDVAVTLTQRVLRWIPGPVLIPFVPPSITGTSFFIPVPGPDLEIDFSETPLLARFEDGGVSMPKALAAFQRGDLLIRIIQAPDGPSLQVFEAPLTEVGAVDAQGHLLETVPLAQAHKRTELAAAAELSLGDVAIVHPGGKIGKVWPGGHWEYVDIPVPITPLTNGDESVAMLISQYGTPLLPGRYTLHLVMDRPRWRASGVPDPEQTYHQERPIDLQW